MRQLIAKYKGLKTSQQRAAFYADEVGTRWKGQRGRPGSPGARGGFSQPTWRSGHDTVSVKRMVCIVKSFKTQSKFMNSKLVLERCAGCAKKCVPLLYGSCDKSMTLVMEDVGKTLTEANMKLMAAMKKEILAHFRHDHGIRFHPCQISPRNICLYADAPVLVDVAKPKFE